MDIGTKVELLPLFPHTDAFSPRKTGTVVLRKEDWIVVEVPVTDKHIAPFTTRRIWEVVEVVPSPKDTE